MDAEGTRPQDLRTKNCRRMLHILSEAENQTVNEIVAKMHLSRTAVQNILQKLVEDGMVVEREKRSSTRLGGKRAASYAICPDYRYSVFIYLNSDSVVAELNNFALEQMDYRIADVSRLSYDEMIGRLAESIRGMLEEFDIPLDALYGVAIAVSGMVDEKRGVLLESTGRDTNSPWGGNRNLAEDLGNALGGEPDIYLDNMCNFSGYASYLAVTGGEAESCVYVMAHSYGIGATFVRGGRVRKGVHGLLGELGHLCLDHGSQYLCRCGRRGCFEAMLYPENIQDRTNAAVRRGLAPGLIPDMVSSVDDLLRLADDGNAYALEQVQVIGHYFARLFYNIQLMEDPECIIFHDAFPVRLDALHRVIETACGEEMKHPLKVPVKVLFDTDLFTERVRRGAALCLRNRFLDKRMG